MHDRHDLRDRLHDRRVHHDRHHVRLHVRLVHHDLNRVQRNYIQLIINLQIHPKH